MEKSEQVSVLLCDDSLAIRTALRSLLETDPRFKIVGEASDGVEAVERAAELHPNIVLLDVTMPRMTGIEALPKVIDKSPHSSVVLLTAFSRESIEQSTVMQLDSLRGVYYMDKTADGEELLDNISTLADASLATSMPAEAETKKKEHLLQRAKPLAVRRTRRSLAMIGAHKRFALAGATAVALAALAAATVAIPAQSAPGSCVHAAVPAISRTVLYSKATHTCSGSRKMFVFIQGRQGRGPAVYTLASGSTTGTYLKVGATRCALRGTWHVWTLATRGLQTDTSNVLAYSCATSSATVAKPST